MLISEGSRSTAGGGIGWPPAPTVERGAEASDPGGEPGVSVPMVT